MDEMNNVMMENETSTEVVPVETLVPVTEEEPACNNDCESSAGVSFGTIVKVGAGVVLVGAAVVKYGVPLAKKGFKRIKGAMASKKAKNEVIEVESNEGTSDEEITEEK